MEIIDRIRLLFRREKKPFLQLKEILGFYPHNIRLYQLALRHKSVAHYEREEARERGGKLDGSSYLNNERLEFLGDAVLGAVVADILYRHYGNKQEGFLTKLRSNIVCRKSLNNLAVQIGLDKLIRYSGAATTAHNSFMNGNAFEAFFGAIYLDRGYSYCYKFMEDRVFKTYINVNQMAQQDENFKSSLIEWCQKHQFQFVFSQHEVKEGKVPKFISEVSIEGLTMGKGTGYSKKESDQMAAKNAMGRIKDEKRAKSEIIATIKERKRVARLESQRTEALSKIKMCSTFIFDLDGTLMDTLKDLSLSVNHALAECGYPEHTIDEIRMMVGNGVSKLIERAVPEGTSEEDVAHCLAVFKEYYVDHCQDNTDLYPGIRELLAQLKQRKYKIAIVSNKLQAGVTELHEAFFLDTVDVAIGESEDVKRKPEPDMVLKALEQLQATSDEAVYVGDSDVDIETARNSSLPCISVLWGFRDKACLEKAGASVMVEHPEGILNLL